jgi:hypothetical protein
MSVTGTQYFPVTVDPLWFYMCVSVSRKNNFWTFLFDPTLGVTGYLLGRSDADNSSPTQSYSQGMGPFYLEVEAKKKTGLCTRKIYGKFYITVDDPIKIASVYFKDYAKDQRNGCVDATSKIVVETGNFYYGSAEIQVYSRNNTWQRVASSVSSSNKTEVSVSEILKHVPYGQPFRLRTRKRQLDGNYSTFETSTQLSCFPKFTLSSEIKIDPPKCQGEPYVIKIPYSGEEDFIITINGKSYQINQSSSKYISKESNHYVIRDPDITGDNAPYLLTVEHAGAREKNLPCAYRSYLTLPPLPDFKIESPNYLNQTGVFQIPTYGGSGRIQLSVSGSKTNRLTIYVNNKIVNNVTQSLTQSNGYYSGTVEFSLTATCTGDQASGTPYKIDATNGDCTSNVLDNIQMRQPALITFDLSNTQRVDCNSSSLSNNKKANGEVTVSNLSGGIPSDNIVPYTFSQAVSRDGNGNYTITGLQEQDNFEVTIRDAHGNSTTKAVPVVSHAKIEMEHSETAPTFPCGNDGTVSVISVSGGIAPYEYSHTNDNMSYSPALVIPDYSSGSQQLFVQDGLGCVFAFDVEIPPGPDALSIQIDTIVPVSCFNGYDGRCILIADHAVDTLLVKESSIPESQITISNDTVVMEGLSAGNYYILLADATCESRLSFTVPGKTPIGVTSAVTYVSDKGTATGSVLLNIGGGNGGYMVELTETGEQITAPSCLFVSLAGSATDGGKPYLFEITDSLGCSYHAQAGDYYTVRVPEPAEKLRLSANVTTSVSCHGGSDATVMLQAEGGWSEYLYSRDKTTWTATDRFFDLPAGEHRFFVKDRYSGTDSVTVTVSQPALLSIAVDSVQHVLCHAGNTGWIRYRVSGGTFPYSFAPDRLYGISFNVDTLLTAQGLIAENYTLTVKDSHGCEITALQQEVSEPSVLKVSIGKIVHTTCELPNGMVTGFASGGVAPYHHTIIATDTWKDEQDLPDADSIRFYNLPAKEYHLVTKDMNKCLATSALFSVNEYENPLIISHTIENIRCFGEQSGNIQIEPLAGTSPIDYVKLMSADSVLTQTNASGIFDNLPRNEYYVNIFDVTGCKSSQTYSIVLSEPEALTVRVDSVHHVAGKGTSTGYISFRIEGGNSGTKQIRLTDADGAEIARMQERSGAPLVFSGLPAGKYVIEAVDRKGCAVLSNSLTVEEPATALGLIVTQKQDALCKSQTGSITVEGSGGWGDYRYKRLANNTFFKQNTFTQLYAGTYVITVTDRMGATCSETVTVYEPRDNLSAMLIDLLPPSCGDNGSLTVKVNGGTAPYRLSEDSDTLHIALPQTVQLAGKTSGTHVLRLLDANGCHFDLEAPMPDTALLQITSFKTGYPSSPGVSDGSVRAVVKGGRQPLAWQWKERFGAPLSANDAMLENIPSGHYQTDVTDGSGCAVTGYVYLPDHTDATFEIVGLGHETAYGAGNGYAILYPENDILTEYQLISPSGERVTYSDLSSDDRFHTGEDTIYLEKLEGGTWFFSGKSTNGRNVIAEFRIEPYEPFVWLTPEIVHARTYGATDGRITIETAGGGGGNRFEWTGADGNIPSTDDPEISTVSNIPAGLYTVTATDRYGNSISESFTVMEPEKPLKLSVYKKRDGSCKTYRDAYVILQAEGGWGEYHFRHDTETYPGALPDFSNLEARNHRFYLLDKAGISDSIEVEITEPDWLRASLLAVDSVLCKDAADGRMRFTVGGGTASYRLSEYPVIGWTQGTELTGLPEGYHTVVFTDANNCIGQDTLTVYMPEPDSLLFRNITVTHTTCNEDNGKLEVVMQGGTTPYQYRWTDAQNLPAGDQNHIAGLQQGGLYRLTVTDRNGCGQQLQQVIYPSSRPAIDHIAVTPVVCYGESTGTAAVTAVTAGQPFAPWHLEWSNGEQTEEGNVGDAVHYAYGMHYVTVADTNGCATVRYFDVSQPDFLRPVLLDSKEPHCYGWDDAFLQTVALGGVAPYLFRWSNGDTVAIADNLTAGEYLLLLVDANRCRAQATYTMDEPEELFVDLGAGITMCPGNTFTVDGHSFPAYRWFTESGGNLSDERYLAVREAGDYRLEATDERGCAVKGQFTVAIGNNALDAAFLLPSTAAEGDTLVLIELSNLPVDSLRWEYDLQAFVPVNDPGQQGYLLMLLCRKTGMYNIGLTAWSGGCTSYVVSQTDIVPASEKPEESALGYKDPLIRSLTAYPNPSNGFFDVEIELREKTDIRLTLFDVASGQRMGDRLEYGMDRYLLHYALTGYRSGVYLLLLTAGNERKQVKVVIQK